jgi:RNA polymerase sigma-70 factor (ECF subfamily)
MQAGGDVVRLQRRDVEAPRDFSTFFVDESPRLFEALYFVTGNKADAAEIMQDAFLKLWERWDSIDRIDDPTGYLFRVALNGFRSRSRTARRAARKLVGAESPRDPFEEIELREDVRRLLLGLAPRQRAALLLLDMYGYGSEEAARIMGIRRSTVRALAAQGRAVLRTTGSPHA